MQQSQITEFSQGKKILKFKEIEENKVMQHYQATTARVTSEK